MEKWKRSLWILWVGVLLSAASYTMIVPFLPLYLLDLGVNPTKINLWSGVVFSITFLISSLMAPYWGSRADKYGKRKMVIRAGISLAVVYFLGGVVRTPEELFLVRALQGFASGFVPASLSIVASSAPDDKMGWSLGIMQTGTATGGILGPLVGGVFSHFFGMRVSFAIAAVGVLLATMAVWLFVEEGHSVTEPHPSTIKEDLKMAAGNAPLMGILLLLMTVQVVVMALQPLITLHVAHLQGALEGAVLSSGIIFSLTGVAGIIAAPSWGKYGQDLGFYKILFIALIGAGLMNVGQYWVGTLWQFSLLQFVFGLFIIGVYPSINTLIVEHTELHFRGRAFGLSTSANQMGGMIGPLLGGIAGSWMSVRSIFVSTGILLLFSAFMVWKLTRPWKEFLG